MTEQSIDTGTGELICVIRERVAIITLNRPHAKNSLSSELTPAFRKLIRDFKDDSRVGALLVTGTGDAFCSGGDVNGMGDNAAPTQRTAEQRIADLREKQRTFTGALVALRKPTIAALPGVAAGAGMSLALACDIRIAAASASLVTAYLRIGFSGDYGISWLLTRTVGPARARELLLTSRRVDATSALGIGLVNEVVPDAELPARAFALAKSLAGGPRDAIRLIKDNLDQAMLVDFETSLDAEAVRMIEAGQSPDHREAVRAFIEKRKPVFTISQESR
jgi:2-(1,2-epoxy-1,2-dihydrophenyl)acetyl-CoA isomerase